MSFLGGLAGGSGGGDIRGVNLTSQQGDPWSVQAHQQSLDALQQQQQFLQALQAQGGVANQSSVFQQQQALANQLQQNAAGQGPNPAQAMLANQTGQNVNQQAALMGSQRGTSANAGLMARQAAMQGANIQQQGVGQAAAMQAQQQLAAQSQLQQQQASMAGLAGQQVSNLGQAQQMGMSGTQGEQGIIQQGVNAFNSANVGAAGGQQQAASSNYGTNMGMLMGAAKGAAGAFMGAAGAGKAHGGMIDSYSNGGSVAGPMSKFGQKMCSGGVYMKAGGHVPGQAQVKGDSKKNDTVPAMLSPGEIVIPRSVVDHPDAPNKAAAFVAAVLARKGRR